MIYTFHYGAASPVAASPHTGAYIVTLQAEWEYAYNVTVLMAAVQSI